MVIAYEIILLHSEEDKCCKANYKVKISNICGRDDRMVGLRKGKRFESVRKISPFHLCSAKYLLQICLHSSFILLLWAVLLSSPIPGFSKCLLKEARKSDFSFLQMALNSEAWDMLHHISTAVEDKFQIA